MKGKNTHYIVISILAFVVNINVAHAQNFILKTKGASTINKANVLLKVDDIWGSNRIYGEFMYNNANFKIKDLMLLAGPHTLIVRPGKESPVSIVFNGEDQKEYEIVTHDGQVKVFCITDDTFVATGSSALYQEVKNASSNGVFQQNLKVQLEKVKANIRIHTMDGHFGGERLHYGGYAFPDQDGSVKINLTPGKHTVEFSLNTKGRFSEPIKLDFDVMEDKTYTLKLELHKQSGTNLFQFGKNYFFSAEVVESVN